MLFAHVVTSPYFARRIFLRMQASDKEYAVIQLIEDSAERQSALDALNTRYNENRLAAAREYAQTLAGVVMPVWESDDIQQANQQVDTLLTKLREYSMAGEGEKPAPPSLAHGGARAPFAHSA